MSNFPTMTDLEFYNSKRQPGWVVRIAKKLGNHRAYATPEFFIDHCVNVHAGLKVSPSEIETSNMMTFVKGWMRRGESVHDRLVEIVNTVPEGSSHGPRPTKRRSLARKWLRRIA